LERWRSYRRIASALALNKRGELRADGLSLCHFNSRLEIDWCARDVHPWDRNRDLPESQMAKLFAEQCLKDTSTAIEQLFCRLPEIEFIDFRVIDPNSSAPILQGSVGRKDAEALTDASPGMRLRKLGATYRLSNWRFEPLS
jgi:hypothetical protein